MRHKPVTLHVEAHERHIPQPTKIVYVVTKITNSIEWLPGDEISKEAMKDIIDHRGDVTVHVTSSKKR